MGSFDVLPSLRAEQLKVSSRNTKIYFKLLA